MIRKPNRFLSTPLPAVLLASLAMLFHCAAAGAQIVPDEPPAEQIEHLPSPVDAAPEDAAPVPFDGDADLPHPDEVQFEEVEVLPMEAQPQPAVEPDPLPVVTEEPPAAPTRPAEGEPVPVAPLEQETRDEPAPPPAPAVPASQLPPRNTANAVDAGSIERQNGGLVLNFRDANIEVVLEELSEAGGFIVVREVQPQGRVTLVSHQPVTPDEAVVLLNTVLHNAGYTALQQGRILKIVTRDAARRLSIPVRVGSDPSRIEPTDELITQVIPLRHADAQELREDLAPLVNPQADFTANASSNALVITDTSANVRRVVQIIAALDTSLADAVDVRVFQLQFANAANAARLINDVFGNLEARAPSEAAGPQQQRDDSPRARFERAMQQAQRAQQPQAGRGTRVNAAADDRTNSLVVTGPGDTLDIVASVIQELDANPVADESVFVYRLRNAQAVNVEAVLNNLFGTGAAARGQQLTPQQMQQQQLQQQRQQQQRGTTGGRTTGGAPGRATGGRATAVTGQFGSTATGRTGGQIARGQPTGAGRVSQAALQSAAGLAGEVSIIADPDTNSILVRTSPANFDRVREVLEELDRPVAQVLIKVLIAEVTHDSALDVGAQFSVLNIRAGGQGQRADTNFNIPVTGPGATGLVVQILESNFTAAIRALETAGKLDVLSRPYILASDNQAASIIIGQQIPIITSSRITDVGGIINTTDYRDIGIMLDVIPHINPDGLVVLDVFQEISALTAQQVQISELFSQPVIALRQAETRVAVRDGQTIVIGGLMEDRKTQLVNKVPILGDLPLIGRAFRRTNQSTTKTELLVFMTPHVAFQPERVEGMSDDELEGTELVPGAVAPGVFDRHHEGLQRGRAPEPAEEPDPEVE